MNVRPFDVQPLQGAWHLAPNPYGARYKPGTNILYERARLGCLPGGAGHGGRDIDSDSSDLTLRAVWEGKVHRYPWDDFGNHIGLVNSDGIEVMYAHLATVHVSDDEMVRAGWDLGIMGATGSAFGVHCHFEIRIAPFQWCTAIDPTNWLLSQPGPTDEEDEMFIFKKTSVSTMYIYKGTDISVVSAADFKTLTTALGKQPNVHTLPDDHYFFKKTQD